MTGQLNILSAATLESGSSIQAHSKYAVRVICEEGYIVSASYDKTICVYSLGFTEEDGYQTPTFGVLMGKLELPTRPEAIVITRIPGLSEEPVLVFSREDSTILYIHRLAPNLPLVGETNLSPHENTWSTFHAMSLSMHPNVPGLVAVGTNHVPHMKLLLVDLTRGEGATNANRVNAITEMEVFTGAPQSAYSTAVVSWRPDGGAIWVNADDGLVRAVERGTGKVKAKLEAGVGQKVRALWAGQVGGLSGREVVVTGGFDKRLRIWEIEGKS